jgi:hypothetical protein
MKRFLLMSAFLLFTACTPAQSPQNLVYFLDKGFTGHPVNQFFYQYGFPSGEFTSTGDSKYYRWTSIQPAGKPGTLHSTYQNANGSYDLMDNPHTGVMRQYCELRIYTDSNDVIRNFAIVVDSIGKWTTSRCSEIFDKTY